MWVAVSDEGKGAMIVNAFAYTSLFLSIARMGGLARIMEECRYNNNCVDPKAEHRLQLHRSPDSDVLS